MTGKGKGAALRAFSSASSPPFKNVAVLKGFLSVEQNRFKLARFPLETDKSLGTPDNSTGETSNFRTTRGSELVNMTGPGKGPFSANNGKYDSAILPIKKNLLLMLQFLFVCTIMRRI